MPKLQRGATTRHKQEQLHRRIEHKVNKMKKV